MSFILDYIRRRIKNNKNFLCAILGPTGSGKTYSALRLAEELDPSFSVDRVVFSGLEFMRVLKDLPSGSVIVFDEAGVGMSAQEWQKKNNKIFNYVLQTFRYRNIIVFFTTPDPAFITAANRRLFHAGFETVSINHQSQKAILKPKFIQINVGTGKEYRKYLRKPGKFGSVKVKRIAVGMPSTALREAYESRRDAYMRQLYDETMMELEGKKEKSLIHPNGSKIQQEKTAVLLKWLPYEKSASQLAALCGFTTSRQIYEIIAHLEVEGYKIHTKKVGRRLIYWGFEPPSPVSRDSIVEGANV